MANTLQYLIARYESAAEVLQLVSQCDDGTPEAAARHQAALEHCRRTRRQMEAVMPDIWHDPDDGLVVEHI